MNCPSCSSPIPDAAVVKAAASINGKRNAGKGSRPGALGLVRNPAGSPATLPRKKRKCAFGDDSCPCQDGDACHYVDTATTKAWPAPASLPRKKAKQ